MAAPTGSTLGRPIARRHHGGCDPVAALVARELGVMPATVHAWMWGRRRANLVVAQIITGYKRLGQERRLVRWLAPIEAALRGIPSPPDTPALAVQAQTADGDEDVAEVALLTNPCEATARQLIRAIDTERALQLERRQALAARWGLA